MRRRTYYMVLGVSGSESPRGIRQAFRELAKRYHPDRVGSERLGFFQEILQAYHVLADPERRSQYDQGLYQAGVGGGATAAPVSLSVDGQRDLPRTLAVLRILSVKDLPFEAALALVSGSLTSAEPISKKYAEGLNAKVILSSHEATEGGVIFIAVPSCSPCERCGGKGREGFFPCSWCDGEGLFEEEELVRIQIPPMVGDGTLVEVPLRGLGVHNFYLRVNIRVTSQTHTGVRHEKGNTRERVDDGSDWGRRVAR